MKTYVKNYNDFDTKKVNEFYDSDFDDEAGEGRDASYDDYSDDFNTDDTDEVDDFYSNRENDDTWADDDEWEAEDNGEEYEDDYDEEGYYESVYHDGNLYEAKIKLTGKEKKKRDAVSQLMSALNKEPDYQAAKEKFLKVYKVLAKKKISELGLKIKVDAIDKVTLKDI